MYACVSLAFDGVNVVCVLYIDCAFCATFKWTKPINMLSKLDIRSMVYMEFIPSHNGLSIVVVIINVYIEYGRNRDPMILTLYYG